MNHREYIAQYAPDDVDRILADAYARHAAEGNTLDYWVFWLTMIAIGL